jgi:hypothetical protein
MNDQKTILVEIKQVYGNELIYPLCDISKALCDILKHKTLSIDAIEFLKLLGYSIKQKGREL